MHLRERGRRHVKRRPRALPWSCSARVRLWLLHSRAQVASKVIPE